MTALSIFINAILTTILVALWQAYGAEKGKNIARQEDLNKLVVEMRALTRAQEETRSQISNDVWQRQTNWNQKRDIYADLLVATRDLSYSYAMISALKSKYDREKAQLIHDKLMDVFDTMSKAQDVLSHTKALAAIFASDECNEALDEHTQSTLERPVDMTSEWAEHSLANMVALRKILIKAAKADLQRPN